MKRFIKRQYRSRRFSFFVQFVSFDKRKANSTIEHRKCKGHEKLDRLLTSKIEFNYQISQRNNKNPINPVFSNRVTF